VTTGIKVSDFHGLSARPFYFSLLHVSPLDDRKLFLLVVPAAPLGRRRQDDDTDRPRRARRPSCIVDRPANPDRMIQGNDGGAYVTENGAKSWRFLNNLPIGQFYMVAADQQQSIYGVRRLAGQQRVVRAVERRRRWWGWWRWRGWRRGLNGSEWFTVTGGDGEYAVPAPSDSSILYVDSQNGNITRVISRRA